MKKYRITYTETKFEVYEIEASSPEDAEERYMDEGTLVNEGTEDGNTQEIKEII